MQLSPEAIVAETHNATPSYATSPQRLFEQFATNESGLSIKESAVRLTRHGRNELVEAKPINPWTILLGQFKSLIVWILIFAGIISGALGELVDSIAILAIVVLNALVGFYQEFNAEKSLAALKKMTAPRAKVLRGGSVVTIPAAEIVCGDIILLEAGDLVPADIRLFNASAMKCIEAALTGESEAVEKSVRTLDGTDVPLGDRINMAYMGTVVATGTGKGLVVAAGMNTEIGRIAGMLQAETNEGTPLQKRLESFGKLLVWASLGVVGIVFILGLLRQVPLFELFLTSVTLAVAAVPEGLPAVVTVALALGVQRMARRRALIRRLPAVETLGSTNVICTDKTGTLTVGEMTVKKLFVASECYEVSGEGYDSAGEVRTNDGQHVTGVSRAAVEQLMTVFVGCNNAHLVQENGIVSVAGDPTEGALIAAGSKIGILQDKLDRDQKRLRELPFDSDRKMMTVICSSPRGTMALVKGAPDVVLNRCTHVYHPDGNRPISDADRSMILAQNAEMGTNALRVLAAAYRNVDRDALDTSSLECDLIFVGLAGMYDPPRAEAKEAVSRCHSAGIRVIMITGDHPHTAIAIARELGIATVDSTAISGAELESMAPEELRRKLIKASVFARVTAEHKLRIVKALKANGAVVAMTGDGVNDAPAIKGADIGIAMGRSGTEVTKEASDMVVTDDNFASIVAAVEEGRGIYDNIKKTLLYLLSGNTGELLLMAACIIVGLPMPLLPIHLLWINLVTDGLPALCLATDPIDPDVMKRQPRSSTAELADRGFFMLMGMTGLLTASVSFGVYLYGLKYETLEMARTHAFAVLVFAELLRSFGCRSETKLVWEVGLLSNVKLAAVVSVSFLFQLWSHHNERLGSFLKTGMMNWEDCVMLLAVGAIPLLVLEAFKIMRRRTASAKLESLTTLSTIQSKHPISSIADSDQLSKERDTSLARPGKNACEEEARSRVRFHFFSSFGGGGFAASFSGNQVHFADGDLPGPGFFTSGCIGQVQTEVLDGVALGLCESPQPGKSRMPNNKPAAIKAVNQTLFIHFLSPISDKTGAGSDAPLPGRSSFTILPSSSVMILSAR